MKNKHLILWFTGICAMLLCLMSSCEKEFNPRDKYKDITIVYGLINPADSVHYIRIHKAFLGPESIIVMAKEPDSSLYPVEDLDVRVFCVDANGNSTPLAVEHTTMSPKDSGNFYYLDGQPVYRFEKKFEKSYGIYRLDGIEIKIEVENKKTGKITYAQTSLVNSFTVLSPRDGYPLNLKPNQNSSTFKWNNAKNGRIYDVYYTMRYREGHNTDLPTVFDRKSIVWHVGSYSASKTGKETTQEETFRFNPSAFYAQIIRDIPYDTSLWRSPYREVKITIWCGSEDLYYYHNINNPSQGLAQERPEFTNLKTKIYSAELGGYQELEKEAFGIFSSRIVQYVTINLSPEMVGKYFPEIDRQFKGEVIVD